jgi:Ca2+-binding RTX toxin-like protein
VNITKKISAIILGVFLIGTLYHFNTQAQCDPTATTGNDTITCTGSSAGVDGLAGNDSITNSGRVNTINGNDGNDTIINTNSSRIWRVTGDAGDDYIDNSGTITNILGGDGNDTIINSGRGAFFYN